MFNKSRLRILPINRSTLIAISPIIFLLLLLIWTLLNIGLTSVKAAPSSNATFAVVRRASANIRRGPGMEYGIFGTVRKGAVLPVSGQYVNAVGEHWYRIYLRAFGDAWVSGLVVDISPANANIPTVGLASVATPVSTFVSPTVEPSANTNNGGFTGIPNSGGNNPPSNPPSNPPPATTPDLSG